MVIEDSPIITEHFSMSLSDFFWYKRGVRKMIRLVVMDRQKTKTSVMIRFFKV